MSFDLALWASPSPVTEDQAEAIDHRLAEGDQSATAPSPRVLEFASELMARYPRLEDLANFEDSPWSMSPDISPERVLLCMRWPRAEEISPGILELARLHDLVCYDPQARVVHHPAQVTPAGVLRLESGDGSRAFGPAASEIERQVRRLSRANWYAVLEREEGTYVQAGLGPNAGVPDGKYALEYREGAPERHFRALVDNLNDVAAAFTGFASGDDSWKSARNWTRFLPPASQTSRGRGLRPHHPPSGHPRTPVKPAEGGGPGMTHGGHPGRGQPAPRRAGAEHAGDRVPGRPPPCGNRTDAGRGDFQRLR